MKIKITAVILIISLLLISFPVSAGDFPQSIWEPLEKYDQAVNNGNDEEIYSLGKLLIEIMQAQPDSQTKTVFLAGKFEQISRCAERLGLYDEALSYYEQYIPYGIAMGWTDGVNFAKRKLVLLKSYLNVYIESQGYQPAFFGAKFEPQSGVLFGAAYDNDPRILDYNTEKIEKYFPKKNSVYLIYLEFGDDIENTPRYANYFADAKKYGTSVLLAWNTYSSLADIENYDDYVKRTIDYLDGLGIKIYLRFANEMNISTNGDDRQAYVNSFRYVASYAKQKQNIAVVWSPNDLGAVDRPFEDYYPGDEYVDWVGVSLYTMKYFLGKKDYGAQTDAANTFFMTDEFANPVLLMKPIVDFMKENHINKPLMVSEGGTSHLIRVEQENTTDWAKIQLERMYGELIREYPQLKLMCYFNVERENEESDYALYTNSQMNDLYNQLVENPYYLSDASGSAKYMYQPFEGGTYSKNDVLKLSASAWYPKTLSGQMEYYVDDTPVYVTTHSPFEFELPLSSYAVGEHKIDIVYASGDKSLIEKSFYITVSEPAISVYVNQEKVVFPDQQPVIEAGRTLVPARGIFEKMGMTVSWNAESQKITLKNENTAIEIVIGEATLKKYQNGKEQAVTLDVPAKILGGRTMLPLRAIAETMNAVVDWNGESRSVYISY